MSRRRRAEKREILPDPKFKDLVLSKFMNNLMLDGKKSVSEKIVYGAFEEIEIKMKRAFTRRFPITLWMILIEIEPCIQLPI